MYLTLIPEAYNSLTISFTGLTQFAKEYRSMTHPKLKDSAIDYTDKHRFLN